MALTHVVAPGQPLLAAVEALSRALPKGEGRLTLSGALEWARLSPAPGATALELVGPLYLVSGGGIFVEGRATLFATLSWSDGGIPRTAAGALEDARSGGVDLWIEAAEATPAPAPRSGAPRSGVPRSTKRAPRAAPTPPAPDDPRVDLSPEMATLEPAAAPPPARSAPAGGGWGAAVVASTQRALASRPSPAELGFEEMDGPPDLQVGDLLLHPRFGRCRVARAPVGDKVKVKRPTGGLFDLHLGVVRFTRAPEEDGRRVFRLKMTGRR